MPVSKALAWQKSERDVDGALLACGRCKIWIRDRNALQMWPSSTVEQTGRVQRRFARRSQRKSGAISVGSASHWLGAFTTTSMLVCRCEKAGMWRDFCRHDVNGEIAQVDSKEALAWCKREEGTALQRKTCFHGLGKYLGRTDPQAAVALCDRVPTHNPLYQENCVRTESVGRLQRSKASRTLPLFADAWRTTRQLLLGLSAHTKRLSPERAEAHCSAVVREDLKKRCEAFARRGRF